MPSFSCAGPTRISSSVPCWPAYTRVPRGQRRVEGRHAPVVAAARRLVRAGERRADHHRVGAAGDRLGDVAAGAHAAVGDDVHVHAGLVEVADPGARRRRRWRWPAGRRCRARRGWCTRGPGPTPTRMPTAPVRMRCSAVEYEAQPPTITGISNSRMNFFRLSGWRRVLRHVLGRDDRALDRRGCRARPRGRAWRTARPAAA